MVAVLALLWSASSANAQTVEDFFNPDVLHEIRIDINPSDWARIKSFPHDHTYYPCIFRWKFQGRFIVQEDVEIRARGTGSASSVKPGLRVDFNRFETTAEFLPPNGLAALVMRNNTQDASMMHERVSMAFFRRLGVPASREAHTLLYINDQYAGLYTIVEEVDKRFLRTNFGEDDGYLYKYKFQPGDQSYYFTYKGSSPDLYFPIPFDPKTHENNNVPGPTMDMIRVINQSSDASFQSDVSQYLDLRLFLAHVAGEVFVAETDGFLGEFGTNNFYIYRLVGKNLHRFIMWDKSEAFKYGPNYEPFHNVTNVPADRRNVLMWRTVQFPELRSFYLELLLKGAALAGGPGGWMDQEIDREYQQIRASALQDPFKQCQDATGNLKLCSNEEFEADVVRIRAFARARSDVVRRLVAEAGFQLAAGAPNLSDGGAVNGATFASGAIAPGSLISIFGQRLSDTQAGASSLPLPTTLNGLTVWINGFAAPILFASSGQVNVQVPWEVPAGSAPITAITGGPLVKGAVSNTIKADVAAASPGVFVVVHANGTLTSDQNPAAAGEVLVVYANGLGPVSVAVPTGAASPSSTLATTTQVPAVTIGGVTASVEFSGLTPGLVGLYQVNVRVPAGVTAGSRVPLVVNVGGQAAPPSMIALR